MPLVELVRRRPWVTALGAVAILGLVSLAILHTPPVRARMLAWVAARLEPSGLIVHADRLEYDLTRLDVRIHGLSLATPATRAEPFLRAGEVHAVLGWGAVLGRIVVDQLDIAQSRVSLVRDADGTVNWPSQAQAGRVEQAPYDIHFGRVRVSDLAITFRDAVSGADVEAAALSLDLVPGAGQSSGPFRLAGPARVRWQDRSTTIETLQGRLAWSGRDLSIDALRLVVPEGALQIDGRVETLTGNPKLDLHAVSDSDLASVAPWLALERRLTGGVHIDARITGPAAAPDALITARGQDVGVDAFREVQIEVSGRLSEKAAELTELTARLAGGSVNGSGSVAIDGSNGRLTLGWQQLDLAALTRSALGHDVRPEPGALATGSLDAQWTAARLDALWVKGETRLAASHSNAVTTNTRRTPKPASLPIEGRVTVDLEHQRLAMRAESGVGSVGQPTRATIDLASHLDAENVQRSPLTGSIDVNAADLADLVHLLARAGVMDRAPLTGAAHAGFSVGGTIGDPRITGALDAENVRYSTLSPATLHTQVSATRTEIRLDEIRGNLAGSAVRGGLRLNVTSQRIGGQIDAALKDLGDLMMAAGSPVPAAGALDARATISGSIASPRIAGTVTSGGLSVAGQQIDRLEADLRLENQVIVADRLCLSADPGNRENGRNHEPENLRTREPANLKTEPENLRTREPANLRTEPENPRTREPENLVDRPCQLEARGSIDPARRTYAVHAMANTLPVRPVSGSNGTTLVPLATMLSGEIDGAGSFTNIEGRGRLTLADTQWERFDLGSIEADVTGRGRTVSADIRAPALAATASGTAGLDPDGRLAAHARWEPDDVAAIARRFGWSPPFPFSGSASLALELEGSRDRLQNLHATAVVDRMDLAIDNQNVHLEPAARLEYDGRTARVRDLRLITGSSTLAVAGSLGDPASRGLTATLHGSLSDFAFVQRLTTTAQPADRNTQPATGMSGSIDLNMVASGPLQRPELSATVRIVDGRWPVTAQHAVTGVAVDARYLSGVLTLEQLQAAFQAATVDATGRVPAELFRDRIAPRWRDLVPQAAGPAELTMRVSSVTPAIAAPFADPATLEQFQGRIDASLALRADRAELERLTGTVTLDRAELSVAGVSFDQQRPTRLVVRDGRVDVADWDWGRGDNHLVVSGGLALDGSSTIDVTARTALDLRLLGAFSGPAQPAGRADAQIRLGGTAADPTMDGFVTLTNGELRVADPRLIVSDLAGTLTFARDTMRLERIWASVNGGGTEIAGSVRHRWFKPLDGIITINGRGSAIELEGLRAEADADLRVSLEPRGPLVSGTATLVRSSYREPLSLTGGLLQALRASSTPLPSGSPSMLDDVRLDIRVTTGDDLVVDNNYAKVTASADLRVTGTAAQPIPLGRVSLAEGGTLFFGGNRYRLATEGSIDFTNPAVIEPDLDLRAVTNVNASGELVEVTLTLKGTPATLQHSLDSNKGYSESDLVSLLVTGRTAADATGGYTPGAEELLGYLSGELFGTAARAIGVDVLRVERGTPGVRYDAGLVASETDPTSRLTFGKNVGRKTQVVFSQSLRESGGLTWIVSYAPLSQAELRAVALDRGDRLYDFRHDVVFGKARAARARLTAPEPRVTGVSFSGAGAEEATLRDRLHLDVGDRFSFFRWQDDRDRLEAFYHQRDRAEARVTTRRTSDTAVGTAISYTVEPGPRTTIVVEGFAFPRRVNDTLRMAWTHAVIDEFLVAEVETIIRGELADRGYVRPSVTAKISATPDAKQLRVSVEPGPHTRDRRIVFEGNGHVPTTQLREAVRDPELARAVWLNPNRVRDRLTALYRSEGYLNASVNVGEIALDGSAATRTISISEGEPFHVRDVHVEGAAAMSAGELTKALAAGEMFSEGLIDRARRAIIQSYRQQGFNSVAVTLRTEAVPERAEVDVAITVEEGAQQRVRDVVMKGLERTRPALVARALKLEAGQAVNLAEWSNARRRLFETGVFRSVDIEPEPMVPATDVAFPNEQPVRAVVTLEEWPALRLRYGLEVEDQRSSERTAIIEPTGGGGGRTFDLGVGGEVASRSLLGRAISAGVAGRYTRDFRAARTYLTTPSLFGLPIVSNVFLSRSREAIGEAGAGSARKFVTDVTSLTLEQRARPRGDLEIAYRYAFEHNHTFDLHPDPDNPLPFDVPVTIARLGTTGLFDTRNDLVDTARGWFHSSDFEYSPTSLGTDVRFVKYLLQQRYFHPAGPVVIAGAARVGLASAFGQRLIPSERFFAGGGNSVRGYAEDALSPRDVLGFAVGGTALVVLNGEMRFPVFKQVRGVGFLDAGQAFESVSAMSLSGLSIGTGAGLRVQTPVVLLRIDLGVPLDSSIGPRRARWFFSVGQAF